jgi:hypothetical protein
VAKMTTQPPVVYILGEDHERMQPFLKELDSRGLATEVWNTGNGALMPLWRPPPGVFYCRQSPSAWSRGNTASAAYAKQVLQWLHAHGADVVNGLRALEVETSKSMQMMCLDAAGLNTPTTLLVQGFMQAAKEAADFNGGVILKPNHGGSGKSVEAFADGATAARALRSMGRGMTPAPESMDGLWVLQDFIGAYSTDPLEMKTLLRIEVVGGRVQRDCIVKITAPAGEFSLCPCDPRSDSVLARINFMILTDPTRIPGFDGDVDRLDAFCAKIERAFELAGATIGSVEGVVLVDKYPEQACRYRAAHEPVLFEMNCNVNYNERAEAAAGIRPGVARVVDYLQQRLEGARAGAEAEAGASAGYSDGVAALDVGFTRGNG